MIDLGHFGEQGRALVNVAHVIGVEDAQGRFIFAEASWVNQIKKDLSLFRGQPQQLLI